MSNRSNIDIAGNTVQVQNLGTGEGEIFKDKVLGNTLRFRTLKEGANVAIIQNGDEITISAATGGGGGDGTFISLTDTPANYTGSANCYVKVNAGATALEFVNPPSGAPAGADGSIQYNNNGTFSGATMFYDNSTETFILGTEGDGQASTDVYFTYQKNGCYTTDNLCFVDMGFYGNDETYRSFLTIGVEGRNGFICSGSFGEGIDILSDFYDVSISGACVIICGTGFNGGIRLNANELGFFDKTSVLSTKPTITGSRGGNAALASLLTALSNLGLVTDSTT